MLQPIGSHGKLLGRNLRKYSRQTLSSGPSFQRNRERSPVDSLPYYRSIGSNLCLFSTSRANGRAGTVEGPPPSGSDWQASSVQVRFDKFHPDVKCCCAHARTPATVRGFPPARKPPPAPRSARATPPAARSSSRRLGNLWGALHFQRLQIAWASPRSSSARAGFVARTNLARNAARLGLRVARRFRSACYAMHLGGPVDDRERVGRRHRPRPAHGGSRSAIAEPTGRGESHRGRGRDHGCLVHRAGELRCRRLQPCTCERLTE